MARTTTLAKRRASDEPLPPLVVSGGGGMPARAKEFVPPSPGVGLVALRLFAWMWAWAFMALAMLLDGLRGRLTLRRRAHHVRRALERMGGTAIKVGQQIAMRLDALPLELASELARMVDVADPMDVTYALSRVELAVGAPVDEAFEAFDPTPIRSDCIACVYQAVMRDGTKVAVKIRREKVARLLNADRVALELLTKLMAPLIGKSEMLEHVLDELPQLLFENLDYVRVARLQRIFRRQAKRTRMKHVTAANVYMDYCTHDVIVSEFISGVWLSEVIAARENGDDEALAKLEQIGISPEECGRRLLHICWWGFFENFFLCQLPSPSDIVVRPGGRLVFIDLGDTGTLEWRERKMLLTMLERLTEHDVEGAVAMLIQLMLPLPYIDVHELSKRAEASMLGRLFAMENKDSDWRDRSSTGMWVSVLEIVQDYDIPIRLDISRMIQAMCVYDHMAGRLWPRLRVLKEFKRYLRQAQRRNGKRVLRQLRKASAQRDMISPWARGAQIGRLLSRANLWLESVVESVPIQYVALSSKGAHSLSQTIHALAIAGELALLGMLGKVAFDFIVSGSLDVYGSLRWVVFHPVFIALLIVIALLTIRRIMFRLDDMDPD